MRGIFAYFYLQLKRVFKLFPFFAAMSLVLAAGMVLFFAINLKLDGESEEKKKFYVGIVGETEDSYLQLGIDALKTFDSSRFAIDFEELYEDEARARLMTGELSAYIVVPDGFVECALRGELLPIKYVSSGGMVGLNTMLKDEVTAAVSETLVHTQKGVYGMEQGALESGVNGSKLMDDLSFEYVELIINRTNMVEVDTIGVSSGMTLQGYLLCGIVTLFLLLLGITCAPLFVKSDMSLHRVIAAKGIAPWKQVLAEYGAYLVTVLIVTLAVTAGIGAVSLSGSSVIPEIVGLEVVDFIDLGVRMIPVALTVAAFQFFMYEITSGIIGGVLLQFLTVISMGYISGCVYPVSFLPEVLQKVSAVLPSGVVRAHIEGCVSYQDPYGGFLGLFLYFVIFLGLSCLVRKFKVEGRQVGA